MKAKFGALMTDGRGKSGGHVLTRNRQGAAMRTKASPVQRRSNTQQQAKSRFTSLSQAWRNLTEAQRVSWNNAAPDFVFTNVFGDSYSPTGKNLFMLLNENILNAGGTQISAPVLPVSPTALTSFAIGSNTSAAQTLTFAASPVPANEALIIEATRPLSAGIYAAGSSFRKLTTVAAAATSPVNTFAAYSALFGTPVTGKKIFFRATPVSITTGIKGIPLQVSGTTA
jgi:hypothetical protein